MTHQLTAGQRRSFVDDGFVVLPQVVPTDALDRLLRLINHSIGHGMDGDEADRRQAMSSAPELRSSPELMGLLFDSPTFTLASSLFVPRSLVRPTGGQIAVRFPQGPDDEVRKPTPHIDGLPLGWNGVDTYRNFNLLVGVALRDIVREDGGNLVVWPGSHRLYESHFREHGIDTVLRGEMPKMELPERRHMLMNAGDVVLAHYQLGHTVAAHLGPDIRYMAYFRLEVEGHEQHTNDVLTDIWLEWDGLREPT